MPRPVNVPNKFGEFSVWQKIVYGHHLVVTFQYSFVEIKVRREHIFEDSYRVIMSVPSNQIERLKAKLWIEFEGEVKQKSNCFRA